LAVLFRKLDQVEATVLPVDQQEAPGRFRNVEAQGSLGVDVAESARTGPPSRGLMVTASAAVMGNS
jgi:hypothetical protein